MLRFISALAAFLFLPACTKSATVTPELKSRWNTKGLYDLTVNDLAGARVDLSKFAGKVTLVVNTASECGFTPQYEGLQVLHSELADRGFSVVAFPCNEFGSQEPGSGEEIAAFCQSNYAISFPVLGKVGVKQGETQSEVYSLLGTHTGDLPGWNFGKYLVAKDGTPIAFYGTRTEPDDSDLRAAIEAALER
jgi:glutathione peroxidase